MATTKLLLDDTGDTRTYAHLSDDGELILDPHTDDRVVKAILDQNHEDRATGSNRMAHGRHAARVPRQWREQWRKEWKKYHSDKFSWTEYLVMQLNKSENKHMLTGVRSV